MNKKQMERWKAEFDSVRVLSKGEIEEYDFFDKAIALMMELINPKSGFLHRITNMGWKLTGKLMYQNRNIIWLKKELKKAKKLK